MAPSTIVRYSPTRVVAVTLGLSGAGAVFGGVAGATALGLGLILTEGLPAFADFGVLAFPAVIGAGLGAVLAPLAGWLLLRRVPLGRAFGGLTLGTILGGLAGWFLPAIGDVFVRPIITAALGFVGAAVFLRLRYSRQDSHFTPAPSDGAT